MRDWKLEVRAQLAGTNIPPARESDIVEELSQHLRDRCEELQGKGHSEDAAEIQVLAEIEHGRLPEELQCVLRNYAPDLQLGEDSRGNFLASIVQDIRYAVRVLRLNPAFTIVCVVSLALGIGANTAIFQLIDSVRLRTLPVKDPQQFAIVRIKDRKWASGRVHGTYPDLTYPMLQQIRDKQEGFSSIAAWGAESFNLANGGEVHNVRGIFASGDFFRVLGVRALLGRVFNSSDDVRGCTMSGAVVSYSFWQRELGGDPAAIGRNITLEGHPFQVIGVTPANFYGVEVGRNFNLAIPICSEPIVRGEGSMLDMRDGLWLGAIGRLKPGWNLEKASAQLDAISPGIMEATMPAVYDADDVKHYSAYRLAAFPGANGFSALRKEYENPLWLLLGVAGLVLLIACANLANLLLARASAREREVAVRLALGAARVRLIRQMLTESLLLAVSGTAIGALLATGLSGFLVRFLSSKDAQVVLDRGMDWRVLGFTAALACATCVLFGLAPAFKATRMAPAIVMNTAGRGNTSTRERFFMRRTLAVTQVALSLVLLVGALLFVRTLRNLLTLDAGFQRTGVLAVDVDFARLKIPMDQRVPFRRTLLDRVRALPGVEAAAETLIVPVSGYGWVSNIIVNGVKKDFEVNMDSISPGYFRTTGMALLAGRRFNDNDNSKSQKVAIVNREFARQVLGVDNPVGRTFKINVFKGEPQYDFQIVGLVNDTKYYDLREKFKPIAFYPTAQDDKPEAATSILVRSQLPLSTVMMDVKDAIAQVNGEVGMDFYTLDSQIQEGLLRERLLAALSGFFGLLAGILATVGLYGVIAYTVVRRTNEIGIRMALGARPTSILQMVVAEAATLLAIGVTAGVAISLVATRAATTLLFGLKPYDPLTIGIAVLALGGATIAASLLPALRAAHLDPMVALREQ